tara:strand:- start:8206 stop:10101 length:1896 start_codon:yes stop_codon:yes gene_type:complete
MAKKFVGFKPETLQNKVLPALGYNGPMDDKSINVFLASNPAAAARMGKFTLAARRTIEGSPMQMAEGGDTTTDEEETPPVEETPVEDTSTENPMGSASKITKSITSDPRKITIKADTVSKKGTGTDITANTGQADPINKATGTTAEQADDAVASPVVDASTVEASTSEDAVDKSLKSATAAEGEVSDEATMEAAEGDPTKLKQLKLDAAQGEAATVEGAPTRELETGELISGSTVDQQKVKDIYGEDKLEAASVQDEMASLMEDFEGGATPAWAAGAMRGATAAMAARGLSASSMAGMAIVQAAMESALPIAQMDASNKQEVAMESARQRAGFLNMEFTQEFQTKVQNAAKVSEIANMNFTAQQQVALENAKMAQTMNLANLSNRQAKVMADAAAMTGMEMANLDNRQQAQLQNAEAFLQMDMANLDNEQQMNVFKAQERVNAILSDTAAVNAAKQFNATSENQTNQFFASLATQVSQFNSEQKNAMSRFNAGETNALARFNTDQENARDQFNATNHLVVAQANAQWAQSVTTAENAANNQANRDAALAANNLTMTAYNNIVQRERDVLAWAWQSGENAAQRDANIAVAKIQAEASADAAGDTDSSGLSAASGSFLGQIAINAADYLFGKG